MKIFRSQEVNQWLSKVYLVSISISHKFFDRFRSEARGAYVKLQKIEKLDKFVEKFERGQSHFARASSSQRGDVPGWVLVVLMTTGLVTGIWTVAQPRLSSILKNSLDNMNSIR